MGARLALLVVFVLACAGRVGAQVPAGESLGVLGEVRVHGNHTTPDAEILAIAGLTVGAPVTEAVLRDAAARLRQSGRFEAVEVRQRFRSIDDPSDILVILLVVERPGVTDEDLTPGLGAAMRHAGLWLPVLHYDEGYGFTYGARVSFVDLVGNRSRISVPLTWGGERRAALEVDRQFDRGPVSRLEASAAIARRVNPHFEIADTRQEVRARAERTLAPWLRVGGGARLTRVEFGGLDDTFATPGLDIVADTRIDPAFPRNAVHASARIEQLRFDAGPVTRWTADARGYIGLLGSSVLALRAVSVRASDPLPAYEQPLLGGSETVRGTRAGAQAGDQLAAISAELRIPVTSPLSVGRFGVKLFYDAGTVYPAGAPLSGQRFTAGAGGGVFLSWAVLAAGVDLAWPVTSGTANGMRWHWTVGTSF